MRGFRGLRDNSEETLMLCPFATAKVAPLRKQSERTRISRISDQNCDDALAASDKFSFFEQETLLALGEEDA